MGEKNEWRISRVIRAPCEELFAAWVRPHELANWWGPAGFRNLVREWSAKPGGRIYVVMRSPEGEDYAMGGEFREVAPVHRIVLTCGALDEERELVFELLHTVTFREEEQGTRVTVESRVLSTTEGAGGYLSGFETGMTQSLERLEHLVSDNLGREIVISHVVDGTREMVWDALTDPQQIVKWWGPRDFTTTTDEMEVRPGGVWKHTMHGPDGTNYPNKTIFRDVRKPERLVYSNGGGREHGPGTHFAATWTLEERDEGRTEVTIRMLFESREDRDFVVREFGAIEGGRETLLRLDEHLRSAPVVVERIIKAPTEGVWNALTDVTQMRLWYFKTLVSFRPEGGAQSRFVVRHEGKEYVHLWRVTEAVPGRKIAYTWKYKGYPGSSEVAFELSAGENGGTKLRVTHQGINTFQPERNPEFAPENFRVGWNQLASSLKEFAEHRTLAWRQAGNFR